MRALPATSWSEKVLALSVKPGRLVAYRNLFIIYVIIILPTRYMVPGTCIYSIFYVKHYLWNTVYLIYIILYGIPGI